MKAILVPRRVKACFVIQFRLPRAKWEEVRGRSSLANASERDGQPHAQHDPEIANAFGTWCRWEFEDAMPAERGGNFRGCFEWYDHTGNFSSALAEAAGRCATTLARLDGTLLSIAYHKNSYYEDSPAETPWTCP